MSASGSSSTESGLSATVQLLMHTQLSEVHFLCSSPARGFWRARAASLWWMTPEWGSRALQIPPETQFMLFKTADDGPYVIALPLIDDQTFRHTLRGPKR